ncbi:MAG: hypothetical protein EOR22_06445 [Mesorhizobium sp.]|nr:MAG: hypothetical protein EOR22_06445 [Mesorhizobium sp.]
MISRRALLIGTSAVAASSLLPAIPLTIEPDLRNDPLAWVRAHAELRAYEASEWERYRVAAMFDSYMENFL